MLTLGNVIQNRNAIVWQLWGMTSLLNTYLNTSTTPYRYGILQYYTLGLLQVLLLESAAHDVKNMGRFKWCFFPPLLSVRVDGSLALSSCCHQPRRPAGRRRRRTLHSPRCAEYKLLISCACECASVCAEPHTERESRRKETRTGLSLQRGRSLGWDGCNCCLL